MPSLDIRCTCGRLYHADPAHAGRSLRCRCGRTVLIQVPASAPPPPPPKAKPKAKPERHPFPWRWPGLRLRLPRIILPARLHQAAGLLVWGYLAVVLFSALILWLLGDKWWPATLLLFGPRWILLVPFLPLAAGALVVHPRWLIPLGAALLMALGPVMGFRLGIRSLFAGTGGLRVVTFNVEGGGNQRVAEVPRALADLAPDVMLFQECPEELVTAAGALDGWHARRDRSLCLVSRHPIDSVTSIQEIETRTAGGTGLVTLYRLRAPSGPLLIANIHLETPRSGIEVWRGQGETSRLVRNTLLRNAGSARASDWLHAERVDVIGGDFNMPVESRIYRAHWSDCRNGFSRAGRGFGFTRILVRFSARIDHVLACRGWSPVRAFVGPDLGSDHRPMVVDLKGRR